MSAIFPNTLHISISNPYQAYITGIHKNLRELIRFMEFSKPFQACARATLRDPSGFIIQLVEREDTST